MTTNGQTLRGDSTQEAFDRSLHNIHYRAIKSDDWHQLQLFHRRLSGETVERRFHGGKRELSTPLAHRLTDLDGTNNVGLVATTGTRGRIIGVARYSRIGHACAEVAFVVEDAYQHHGVGHQLMNRLCKIAMDNGITEFIAEVLPGNLPALRLLAEAGSARSHWDNGEIDVHVDLNS